MLRRWKILLLILLGPWLLLAAFLIFERIRGKVSLDHYKSSLAARGEKLTPAEFLGKADPNQQNFAPALWAAVDKLSQGVITSNTPPRMRAFPSGHAMVCYREDDWVTDRITNSWDDIAGELITNRETLVEIRALLQKPSFQNITNYEGGPKMLFPQLIKAKRLTHWFGAGCQLALNESRTNDVLANLLAGIRTAGSLAEDRIAISELVRDAIAAIARTDVWEALQADILNERALSQVQKAWEQQEFAHAMTRALEGEVVFADGTYQLMRKSNEEAASILFFLNEFMQETEEETSSWFRGFGEKIIKFFKHEVYCRVWRFAWLDQDELHYLQFLENLLAEARHVANSKNLQQDGQVSLRLTKELSARNLYHRIRFPNADMASSLTRCMARAMRVETERSVVITAVALKRFQLRHGKPPQTLDALIPDFVTAVPVDYMDGKPIKYKSNPDGQFLLYSVGEDGQDDGGSTDLKPGKTNSRLIWDKKDFVWPAPATAEELETYYREGRR